MSAIATGAAPLSGLSILLLEDEFLIALDAQDILMELGAAQVEVVNTLDAARAALERPLFDLALLDINVNGEMSFPVAEQLAVRNVPVVFASGYELREPPRLNGTPACCISKPYTSENLKIALLSTLAAKRGL
jgi:CheY-like chemotaxis protein